MSKRKDVFSRMAKLTRKEAREEAFRLLFLFAGGGTFCVAGVAFLLAGYICVLLSHGELLAEKESNILSLLV